MFVPVTVTPMTVVGEAAVTVILGVGVSSVGQILNGPFPGLAPLASGSVVITVSSLSNKFSMEQTLVGVDPAAPAVVDPAAPALVEPAAPAVVDPAAPAVVDPVSSLGVVPAGRLVVVETSPHTCIEKSVISIGCETSAGVMTTSMLTTPSGLVSGRTKVPWIELMI